MDSNAHNPLWNSSYEDPKGRELERFLAANPLHIVNKKPAEDSCPFLKTTFIDLTLAGENILGFVKGWKYLDMPSLSDHPFIFFNIDVTPIKKMKSSDWMPHLLQIDVPRMRNTLRSMLLPVRILTNTCEIDFTINNLTDCIQKSAKMCFVRPTTPLEKKIFWWNNFLCSLRSKLPKSSVQFRKHPTVGNENIFKLDKTTYQREIRKAKFNSWKVFCEKDLSNDPFKAVKRLNISQRPRHEIKTIKTPDAEITSEPGILKAFGDTFFQSDAPIAVKLAVDNELSDNFFELSEEEVQAFISSLRPNSAPGIDGIGTALL